MCDFRRKRESQLNASPQLPGIKLIVPVGVHCLACGHDGETVQNSAIVDTIERSATLPSALGIAEKALQDCISSNLQLWAGLAL